MTSLSGISHFREEITASRNQLETVVGGIKQQRDKLREELLRVWPHRPEDEHTFEDKFSLLEQYDLFLAKQKIVHVEDLPKTAQHQLQLLKIAGMLHHLEHSKMEPVKSQIGSLLHDIDLEPSFSYVRYLTLLNNLHVRWRTFSEAHQKFTDAYYLEQAKAGFPQISADLEKLNPVHHVVKKVSKGQERDHYKAKLKQLGRHVDEIQTALCRMKVEGAGTKERSNLINLCSSYSLAYFNAHCEQDNEIYLEQRRKQELEQLGQIDDQIEKLKNDWQKLNQEKFELSDLASRSKQRDSFVEKAQSLQRQNELYRRHSKDNRMLFDRIANEIHKMLQQAERDKKESDSFIEQAKKQQENGKIEQPKLA